MSGPAKSQSCGAIKSRGISASNRLTDYIYGPDATAQQAAGVRHLVGPENPLNLPGQFSEGVDTAATGYRVGSPSMTAAGV